jgi:hypothetical protein
VARGMHSSKRLRERHGWSSAGGGKPTALRPQRRLASLQLRRRRRVRPVPLSHTAPPYVAVSCFLLMQALNYNFLCIASSKLCLYTI